MSNRHPTSPGEMDAARAQRRDQILDAAICALSEHGYRGTTMLRVARRANASKETLYAWFGDKQGLFEAVIARNAQRVHGVLSRHLEGEEPIEALLKDFGAALLDLLLGDHAVAVNRAAIGEAERDPTFAGILIGTGRNSVLPKFAQALARHRDRGALAMNDPRRAAEDFLGLLLGDVQIRRLLGVKAAPKAAERRKRAAHATDAFLRIYGTGRSPAPTN